MKELYVVSYLDEDLSLKDILDEKPLYSDSLTFVNNYINQWIRERVILNKAKIYIDEESSIITSAVNRYKEELMIHKYQSELLNNQFDTSVTEVQIKDYYEGHTQDFILNKDIIKGRIVILNNETLKFDHLKKLISTQDQVNLEELSEFCNMYAERSFLNDSAWVYYSEFQSKLPIPEKESKRILSKRNKTHIFTDDDFIYFLFIKDYKTKDSKSPLSFVFSNIRSLLQNKNKQKFLNKLEDKLYQEALNSEHIKLYK